MSRVSLPTPLDERPAPRAQVSAPPFGEAIPLLLMSLLERRYLSESDFRADLWRIEAPAADPTRPLLREVIALGRGADPGDGARAMPHVLNACHDPGHALIMVLHGERNRQRLYLGARRLAGAGGRGSDDYLAHQESAFKAGFAGLRLGPITCLNGEELPELADLIQTAPALTALTGIPSGRGGRLPLDLQGLDRLVQSVGGRRYVLMVVAEPLDPWLVDQTLDACRRLKGEMHAYARRSISRSDGGSKGTSTTVAPPTPSGGVDLPTMLGGLAVFCHLAGLGVFGLAGATALARVGNSLSRMTENTAMVTNRLEAQGRRGRRSRSTSEGTTWSDSMSAELLDANAEACEALLDQHIARLQWGRSGGCWRTAVYLAAEGQAALEAVRGAVRGIGSGDSTHLDPIRALHALPPYLLRDSMARGQVLALRPAGALEAHPLGESFDSLATCLNSDELAVFVNLPRFEIPGIPMRDLGRFALTPPTVEAGAIAVGAVLDSQGMDVGQLALTTETLNRHAFITGMTGYGKTNTCMRLLLGAFDLGIPFLVIEPAKAEYRRLARTLRGRLRVFTIGGRSGLPFRLNPFEPVPGIPLGRHIDLLKAVFNASFPMFAGMTYILEEALLDIYRERGWSLFTSANSALGPHPSLNDRAAVLPSLHDLHGQIEVVLARKKYGQEVHQNMGAALRSRLRSLMVGNKGLALNTNRSVPPEDLFDGPAVIQLQDLGDDEEKAFVMALVFVLLYEYAEVRHARTPAETWGRLQHLTLIEEAHRLLQAPHGPSSAESGNPHAKAVAMFTDMLAEMRALGEGFLIADQIPTKLAPETLKNSSLKIVHRLTSPDDRSIAAQCMNLTEPQSRHLNNLPVGQAVIHDERIGEAVLVRVDRFQDESSSGSDDHELLALIQATDAGDRRYLHRHAGCRACPSPCDFLHRLEELPDAREIERILKPFFETVLLGDANGAHDAWSRFRSWLLSILGRGRLDAAETLGLSYCAAVQAAHEWLGQWLCDRNKIIDREGRLAPADRLRREEAAHAIGRLIRSWSSADPEPALFNDVHQRVASAVALVPPRESPGCAACPARCRMLAFVAPLDLTQVAGQLTGTLAIGNDASEILTNIEQKLRPIAQAIPLLARGDVNRQFHRDWLYCLLTNLDTAAAAEPGRASALEHLRQSAAIAAGDHPSPDGRHGLVPGS